MMKENIINIKDIKFNVPIKFSELSKEIKYSERLLDWEDEDGIRINDDVYKKSINFIIEHTKKYYIKTGIILDAPQINPGPGNSIDLLWRKENYRLLINISLNDDINFYGDWELI